MIQLPIPSRATAEAAAHSAYRAAIATLPDVKRDPIVTFVNALMDDADERHDTLRTLQVRHDDPVAVEGGMVADGIGYLDVRSCGARTPAQVDAVLTELLTANPSGIVLDLRANHGGSATVATHIASHFVPAGTMVARFVPTVALEVDPARLDLITDTEPDVPSLPLAVIVNRWSASTSEVIAAGLQAHGRAIVVGEKSFGKPNATLTLANADTISPGVYARPDGSRFDPEGVQPDVTATDDSAVAVAADRLSHAR